MNAAVSLAATSAAGGSGTVGIPYREQCSGRWRLWPDPVADAEGARRATFCVDCGEADGLLFDGLYDGERIAGSVHQVPANVVAAAATGDQVLDGNMQQQHLGEFICTRLFTFWGEPKVAAAKEGPKS